MNSNRQRLDKWIWFARFAKTRSLAQKIIASGKVRVNRTKVSSASHAVYPGDVLTMSVAGRIKVIEVKALGHRRGPFSEAQLLYEDLTPNSVEKHTSEEVKTRSVITPTNRPNKRNRRKAIELKSGIS